MGWLQNFVSRVTSNARLIYTPRRPFWLRGKMQIHEDSAMQVAAFHRGVTYIASQIAKLPWDIKDKDNNIINIPISNILSVAANPEMNAFRFRLVTISQALIAGNSYAEIERDNAGRPIALWPLENWRMDPVRHQIDDSLMYRYQNPLGGIVYLDPRDVFHIPNLHTKDGIIGQGVVAYARETLGIQLSADEMASGIFHNSGIPSGILTHPGKLSDEAYKRVKDSWASQHGGRNSGGTSILEEGLKYEAVNVEPEALQFIQSRKFGIEEIARFLGVPPTKLFDTSAATYSNVENANLEVVTDTLDTWCKNLQLEADVKLLNNRHSGRKTDINLYEIFRGDMKTRADYFKTMMGNAAMTPNEMRRLEGMAPYSNGNEFYIASNNFSPVSRMNEIIDADIAQKNKPTAAPAPATKKGTQDPQQEGSIETEADRQLKKAAFEFLSK